MHDQASATTKHRGHTPDLDFLTATYNPTKWDPYFDPVTHLPANLLGDLLAAGIDLQDRPRRDLFSQQRGQCSARTGYGAQ